MESLRPLRLISCDGWLSFVANQVLLWHVNGHANTPNQFTRFLSDLSGTRVVADPVVQPDAMRRLMRGGVELRKVQLRIARPTNPDWYPSDDFSREILAVLAQGGGDSLYLQAVADGRLASTKQTDLSGRWKKAIREFVNDGVATTARVEVAEDGIDHPIDLIADRLLSHIEVDHDGRYAPTDTMLGALLSAWTDVEVKIRDTFGEDRSTLRR
jgi:hypothetical protein